MLAHGDHKPNERGLDRRQVVSEVTDNPHVGRESQSPQTLLRKKESVAALGSTVIPKPASKLGPSTNGVNIRKRENVNSVTVGQRPPTCVNRLCTPTRLALVPRDEAYCVDGLVLNLPKNNPCCRYPIVVQDILLEACIDSGATLCLLSREAYKRIKHIVGPINDTKRKASGAGGEKLRIDGWVRFPFRIGASRYTYSFLVGNLSGIDCLLGLDWLQFVGAVIDFSTMKAEFGPKETVQLSSEPLQIHYCRVVESQSLTAQAHTVVQCQAEYSAEFDGTSSAVMFEPTCIKLGSGLIMNPGIVRPDESGCFCITIQNNTDVDWVIPDDIIIGTLGEIERRCSEEKHVAAHLQRVNQKLSIWNVADHSAKRSSTRAGLRLMADRGNTEKVFINYVNTSLVPCELDEHSGEVAYPVKDCGSNRNVESGVDQTVGLVTKGSCEMNSASCGGKVGPRVIVEGESRFEY